jgi:uncharacterized membrane protein YsdA (DUF1294 family)
VIHKLGFGVLGAGLVLGLYLLLRTTALPPYAAWLAAASLVTFFLYWLDKRLSRASPRTARVPELVLNLAALAGGFSGAWLGRAVWHHKTNVRRHPLLVAVLVFSTLLHAAILYALLT